eukprot:CAMPEP_0172620834 /NCGR_PEP_ID=MMETSP1068-20121228/106702_1 /TAXON_ID=35684 /ORGANISM="Pseudopedinella elastica, Strain CCMP716" /LENGTH=323 /DNA_ID=CAMNT_0013428273 /DNA_START=107 /DNA_END=1078 /DNA_ORIENTATION=+
MAMRFRVLLRGGTRTLHPHPQGYLPTTTGSPSRRSRDLSLYAARHLLSSEGRELYAKATEVGFIAPKATGHLKALKVLEALVSNKALVNFDAEEFIAGARTAAPLVIKLMHLMDPEDDGALAHLEPEARARSIHAGSRRDSSAKLRDLLSPKLYEVVRGTMAQVAAAGQSWACERVEVKRSWIEALETWEEDWTAEAEAYSEPSGADAAGELAGKQKAKVAATKVRAVVTLEVDEHYTVELAEQGEAVDQGREARHTFAFERCLRVVDAEGREWAPPGEQDQGDAGVRGDDGVGRSDYPGRALWAWKPGGEVPEMEWRVTSIL